MRLFGALVCLSSFASVPFGYGQSKKLFHEVSVDASKTTRVEYPINTLIQFLLHLSPSYCSLHSANLHS
jgi:hypothetical protein